MSRIERPPFDENELRQIRERSEHFNLTQYDGERLLGHIDHLTAELAAKDKAIGVLRAACQGVEDISAKLAKELEGIACGDEGDELDGYRHAFADAVVLCHNALAATAGEGK